MEKWNKTKGQNSNLWRRQLPNALQRLLGVTTLPCSTGLHFRSSVAASIQLHPDIVSIPSALARLPLSNYTLETIVIFNSITQLTNRVWF